MPVDPLAEIGEALLRAAHVGSLATAREWSEAGVTERTRLGPENSLAGYEQANLTVVQYGVGWDGTNTFLPFTANVSFINSNGLSTDIVTGS